MRRDVVATVALVSLAATLSSCTAQRLPSGLALQNALAASVGPPTVSPPCSDTDERGARGFDRCVEATGPNWGLVVRWRDDELMRKVEWRVGSDRGELLVPLKRRPRPWTSELAGVTNTRYGPYQPALHHTVAGEHWSVTMSHERIDFPTVGDLKRFLLWGYYSDPSHVAFDPGKGILVTLYVGRKGDAYLNGAVLLGNSLGVEVGELSVAGEPLPTDAFASMAKGSVSVSPAKAP